MQDDFSCWDSVYSSWAKADLRLKAAPGLTWHCPGWKLGISWEPPSSAGHHSGALSWHSFLPLLLFSSHYHNYSTLFQSLNCSCLNPQVFSPFFLIPLPIPAGLASEELRGPWLLAEVKLIALSAAELKSTCFKQLMVCVHKDTSVLLGPAVW